MSMDLAPQSCDKRLASPVALLLCNTPTGSHSSSSSSSLLRMGDGRGGGGGSFAENACPAVLGGCYSFNFLKSQLNCKGSSQDRFVWIGQTRIIAYGFQRATIAKKCMVLI